MALPLSEEERRRIERAVVENTSDCLFYTDQNGVVIWCNQADARQLGYDRPEDLVGTRAVDLYVNPRARGHMMKEVLANGRSQQFVAQMKRRHGEPWYAEITCDAVRDKNGAIVGLVGVARDISERRHLAEDLHRLQEFNEVVLNIIPTCLWTVDLKGTITWVNGALCRLGGCDVGDLVDRSVFKDAPEWIRPVAAAVRKVLDRGTVARAKALEHRLPRGQAVFLDLTVLPLREEGELVGAIVEAVDVTERVKLKAELDRQRGRGEGV